MFPLLRYFSITSFLALTVVIGIIAYLTHEASIEELVETGETSNVALAQLFANSLWPKFSNYVTSVSGSGDELRERSETKEIHDAASRLAENLSVLKLKIYNINGLTVFSSEQSQIGDDKSKNVGFQRAASGVGPVSKLSQRGQFNAFEGTVTDRSLIETYVPIRNDAGKVEGVFELYSDVTPLVQRIERSQINLLLWAVAGFTILYLILFLIVYRANGALHKQYRLIQESRRDLELKNIAINKAVKDRARLEKEIAALRRQTQSNPI